VRPRTDCLCCHTVQQRVGPRRLSHCFMYYRRTQAYRRVLGLVLVLYYFHTMKNPKYKEIQKLLKRCSKTTCIFVKSFILLLKSATCFYKFLLIEHTCNLTIKQQYTLCLKTCMFCFCNKVVECQPISVIFGTVTPE